MANNRKSTWLRSRQARSPAQATPDDWPTPQAFHPLKGHSLIVERRETKERHTGPKTMLAEPVGVSLHI